MNKKILKQVSVFLAALILFVLAGCNPIDPNYAKSDSNAQNKDESVTTKPVHIPEIKSDDSVMPTYFDISLYDEENYADIYLGKKFEYNITYAGSELSVPSAYKEMAKKGWKLMETEDYNLESLVLAGKSMQAQFVNEYNKQITAVFYNSSKSSAALKKCPIVKFIVPENILNNPDSVYGQFWVNGVSNESAITDIIEYLGAPSHFYAVSPKSYYLDYFMFERDKRSGITVYIDPENDCVTAIEVSYY